MDGMMGQAFNLSKAVERKFMFAFAYEAPLDLEICRNQLRCLWTAYCLHFDLNVDTRAYDTILRELYDKMSYFNHEMAEWTFESFDWFMCQYLV